MEKQNDVKYIENVLIIKKIITFSAENNNLYANKRSCYLNLYCLIPRK